VYRDFSNSESDNSSIFGNNRISLSDNSGIDGSTMVQATPKADLVNIVFTWNFGGQEAYLIGSFTNWSEKLLMKKAGGNEFSLLHPLERGVHQYKFIVDGNWRFAGDQPTMRDNQGNINNFIDTTHYASSAAT
jgi:5'-AMP-activated protein kinase regulatory beta subunit